MRRRDSSEQWRRKQDSTKWDQAQMVSEAPRTGIREESREKGEIRRNSKNERSQWRSFEWNHKEQSESRRNLKGKTKAKAERKSMKENRRKADYKKGGNEWRQMESPWEKTKEANEWERNKKRVVVEQYRDKEKAYHQNEGLTQNKQPKEQEGSSRWCDEEVARCDESRRETQDEKRNNQIKLEESPNSEGTHSSSHSLLEEISVEISRDRPSMEENGDGDSHERANDDKTEIFDLRKINEESLTSSEAIQVSEDSTTGTHPDSTSGISPTCLGFLNPLKTSSSLEMRRPAGLREELDGLIGMLSRTV